MEIQAINNNTNVSSTENTASAKEIKGFSSYLGESASLDTIFQKASDTYQVPVELLKAVGKAESNFNPNAVSHCGATGIMQLMPATAASLGVQDSYDPEQNIMGGAKYLSSLLDKYDGDVKLTLAAYNAGSGNVAKYNGIPPFEETQNYVVKVINYMQEDINIPNTTYSTGNAGSSTESSIPEDLLNACKEIEASFTYDDYLTFINLFLNNQSSSDSGQEEDNASSNSGVYSFGNVNLSPAIMNLLHS